MVDCSVQVAKYEGVKVKVVAVRETTAYFTNNEISRKSQKTP